LSPYTDQHTILQANCIAQAEALLIGKNEETVREELKNNPNAELLIPHKVFVGNKPSTTIVYPKISPKSVGTLLALYEHKVFVQGILWDINSFDQWGVELGKQLASNVLPELQKPNVPHGNHDPSTTALISLFQRDDSGLK
jgi:glucose-6-phosphate isomerase